MSGRPDSDNIKEAYKYEGSALILVDFSPKKPKIYWTLDELRADNFVSTDFDVDYSKLSPLHFTKNLVDSYCNRHSIQS